MIAQRGNLHDRWIPSQRAIDAHESRKKIIIVLTYMIDGFPHKGPLMLMSLKKNDHSVFEAFYVGHDGINPRQKAWRHHDKNSERIKISCPSNRDVRIYVKPILIFDLPATSKLSGEFARQVRIRRNRLGSALKPVLGEIMRSIIHGQVPLGVYLAAIYIQSKMTHYIDVTWTSRRLK